MPADHTTPPALPPKGSWQDALRRLAGAAETYRFAFTIEEVHEHVSTVASHIAALARERDEARADLLVKVGNELNEACEVAATAAKIGALEWVLQDLHANRFMPQPDTLIEEINEELARLRAEQEKPSDA